MQSYPLVSIITPCYNGETYVHRFFESVLRQTYPNIELIFVNDGSRDRTEEIALSYTQAMQEKGIRYEYIFQKNAGQAAAVNRGLKEVCGEFLMCSDSDDWLADDCVEKKVAYLQVHPDKMMVLARAAFVEHEAPDKIVRTLSRRNRNNEWIFEDLLFENDIYYAPGSYLMRTEAFIKSHHGLRIYEGQGGQNWQLLLPMSYHYMCGFMDDIVYYIVIHQDSHSRSNVRYDQILKRTFEHEDILTRTVTEIDMSELEKINYLQRIKVKYLRIRLRMAWSNAEYADAKEQYRLLAAEQTPDVLSWLIHMRIKYPLLERVICILRIPWRMIVKLRES